MSGIDSKSFNSVPGTEYPVTDAGEYKLARPSSPWEEGQVWKEKVALIG